jgi:UDP-2,3-diacylglucosamine pyrophosphatase LpxH
MTTTLIVSDIHLGARNSQAASLSALLRTDFDRLILNGDTVDHLNLRRFTPSHWAVLGQLRAVARKRQLILIRGNHEGARPTAGRPFGPLDVLAQLLETELHEEYQLRVGAQRYLVFHGDRFDQTLRMTWLGGVADYCYGVIQRWSRPLARWLKGRVKHWGGVVSSVRVGAVAYARRKNCQGVIIGHTHYHEDQVVDGVHYLNTGCWVDWPCAYIRVEHDRIHLCQWNGTSEAPLAEVSRNAERGTRNAERKRERRRRSSILNLLALRGSRPGKAGN